MLYFFTPYSQEKRLFDAIDACIMLLKEEDWACIMDGDTAFLRSDFGTRIQEYINTYPGAGLFTCYASRCHYAWQQPADWNNDCDSIMELKFRTDVCDKEHRGEVAEINTRIAGHLFVIKKKTWLRIRMQVMSRCRGKKILGIDTRISNEILRQNYKIYLMKGIYIFHYLRMVEGIDNKSHLL